MPDINDLQAHLFKVGLLLFPPFIAVVLYELATFDPGSPVPLKLLLLPLLVCLGVDGPDEPNGPPAHRVQTSARAVRRNAAISLLPFCAAGQMVGAQPKERLLLPALETAACSDEDRYVRAMAAEGLRRLVGGWLAGGSVGLASARQAALQGALGQRWCGSTTEASPF